MPKLFQFNGLKWTEIAKDGKDGRDSIVPGPIGPPGRNGKDGESPKLEAVAEATLKLLEKQKLPMDVIEGLRNTLNILNRNIAEVKNLKLKGGGGGGGGMGNIVDFSFAGDGSTTAFTLDSNVAGNNFAIWAYYQGQFLMPGVHFNVSGRTFTTTFTPANNTTIEGIYIRK